MNCRHCGQSVRHNVIDLGSSPPSNAYVDHHAGHGQAPSFPLRVKVCTDCWLVQTEDFLAAERLFTDDYAYYSSTSRSWLEHAAHYADMITRRLELSADSLVVEIAANDGYLLRNFVGRGIPCVGVEPAVETARVAAALGIPMIEEFFDEALAHRLVAETGGADLIVANNVYAHVPDINGFTAGLRTLLKTGGTITAEFPHLLRLIEECQFDTIYHEHFSYLSLGSIDRIMRRFGLRVFDVEQLPTHGGSLRVYGCHLDDPRGETADVSRVRSAETAAGLQDETTYLTFQTRAERRRDDLVRFLSAQKAAGKTVVGYGAAAKGNTLLNFAGITSSELTAVADEAAAKQGKLLPGSGIPVVSPDELNSYRPDWVLILPWNIAGEIHGRIHEIGIDATAVVAMPELRVL